MNVNFVDNKRLMLVYVTVASWLVMYFMGLGFDVPFTQLSVFFLSLTGFVTSYIWGESVRPSDATSVFRPGKNSTREILIYICVILWMGIGIYGIVRHASLEQLAAYYTSLTPFVSTYILGSSYKQVDPVVPAKKEEPAQNAKAPIDGPANPL